MTGAHFSNTPSRGGTRRRRTERPARNSSYSTINSDEVRNEISLSLISRAAPSPTFIVVKWNRLADGNPVSVVGGAVCDNKVAEWGAVWRRRRVGVCMEKPYWSYTQFFSGLLNN